MLSHTSKRLVTTQMRFACPPHIRDTIPGVSKIETTSEFESAQQNKFGLKKIKYYLENAQNK